MMSKPKVLMCIDWYLPGFRAGGPIRSCANLVGHLRTEVDFYILCSDRDYQSDSAYPDIERGSWQEGQMGEHVFYAYAARLTKSKLKRLMSEEGFDRIYIHGLFSKNFSILPLIAAQELGLPVTIASRGMLRESAIKIKSWKKRLFLKLARARNWYRNVKFHATDLQEQEDILKWIGKNADVHLAANLPREANTEPRFIGKEEGRLDLIFAGRIAKEKNLLYALEILARVKDQTVRLDVYGAIYDRSYFQDCQDRVEKLASNITVNFFDPVPSNEVAELLSTYHALFLPTRGENFGHIILESFMAARPVIISDQTPWIGIEEEGAGFDIPLSSTETFVQKLTDLSEMDASSFEQLCKKSFKKGRDFCNDPELIAASKALFLPS